MKQYTLEQFKENQKTQYYAQEWERLSGEIEELESIEAGEDMQTLVAEEKRDLRKQQEELWKQMELISKGDEEEEEFPNEIILEVRAGAGGDEASLFALQPHTLYQQVIQICNNGRERHLNFL